jgi:hypothetical protein
VDQLSKDIQNAAGGNGTDPLAVHYDDASKGAITLGGGTNGTKITNVAAGDLSSTSTDAVNGSQPMTFAQLLARQRRAKIRVTIPDQVQRALGHTVRQLVVARMPTMPRQQPRSALVAIPRRQPLNLTPAQMKPLCGLPCHQHAIDH